MIFDLPQIPFEVYYKDYNKTVYVIASCVKDPHSFIIELPIDASGDSVRLKVYHAIEKAFDTPDITKVSICRKVRK